jgi:hypothetical protein
LWRLLQEAICLPLLAGTALRQNRRTADQIARAMREEELRGNASMINIAVERVARQCRRAGVSTSC